MIYAVAIMAITLALVFAPLSVSASAWGGNPLAGFDKQTGGNISYHPDYNKSGNIAPKAYGWQFSKVCGLDICAGEVNDGSKSNSFLQNEQTNAPQTLGPYLGMSAVGDQSERLDRLSSKSTSVFSGKFFIKGFFQ
jgi:hypothetical protein